jgi:acyl dehydratase
MAEQAASRTLTPIRVRAVNSASGSRGSIHDDAKAREMGYRGGLVPGVTVLGYLARMMQANFGAAWQADATLDARLRRPVYEGDEVTVEGTVEPADDPTRVRVDLRVIDPRGELCAAGTAVCRAPGAR